MKRRANTRRRRLKPYQQVLFQGRLPVVDYNAVVHLARQEQELTMRKVTAAEIVRRAVREYVSRRAPLAGPADGCQSEQQWLAEHARELAGQWVALDGYRLLGHGPDARAVFQAARAAGAVLPLVVRVEKPDQLPFAGW